MVKISFELSEFLYFNEWRVDIHESWNKHINKLLYLKKNSMLVAQQQFSSGKHSARERKIY